MLTHYSAADKRPVRAGKLVRDGFILDKVMYSTIAEEGPAVKQGLEQKMAAYSA